jgi:FtsH-binding integral membrane protein
VGGGTMIGFAVVGVLIFSLINRFGYFTFNYSISLLVARLSSSYVSAASSVSNTKMPQ